MNAEDIDEQYRALAEVLRSAYKQSADGKGRERHANNMPFEKQSILEISRMVGIGFPTGQAIKKIREASDMIARGEHDKACHEMLGAIVYTAAAIIRTRELA